MGSPFRPRERAKPGIVEGFLRKNTFLGCLDVRVGVILSGIINVLQGLFVTELTFREQYASARLAAPYFFRAFAVFVLMPLRFFELSKFSLYVSMWPLLMKFFGTNEYLSLAEQMGYAPTIPMLVNVFDFYINFGYIQNRIEASYFREEPPIVEQQARIGQATATPMEREAILV